LHIFGLDSPNEVFAVTVRVLNERRGLGSGVTLAACSNSSVIVSLCLLRFLGLEAILPGHERMDTTFVSLWLAKQYARPETVVPKSREIIIFSLEAPLISLSALSALS
jgi:hypothetical protein